MPILLWKSYASFFKVNWLKSIKNITDIRRCRFVPTKGNLGDTRDCRAHYPPSNRRDLAFSPSMDAAGPHSRPEPAISRLIDGYCHRASMSAQETGDSCAFDTGRVAFSVAAKVFLCLPACFRFSWNSSRDNSPLGVPTQPAPYRLADRGPLHRHACSPWVVRPATDGVAFGHHVHLDKIME